MACNPMPRRRASSACEAPNPARHSKWLTRASSLASRGGGGVGVAVGVGRSVGVGVGVTGVAVGVGRSAGVGVGGAGVAVGVGKGVTAASRNGVGVGKGAVVGVDAGAVAVASIRAQAARKAGDGCRGQPKGGRSRHKLPPVHAQREDAVLG